MGPVPGDAQHVLDRREPAGPALPANTAAQHTGDRDDHDHPASGDGSSHTERDRDPERPRRRQHLDTGADVAGRDGPGDLDRCGHRTLVHAGAGPGRPGPPRGRHLRRSRRGAAPRVGDLAGHRPRHRREPAPGRGPDTPRRALRIVPAGRDCNHARASPGSPTTTASSEPRSPTSGNSVWAPVRSPTSRAPRATASRRLRRRWDAGSESWCRTPTMEERSKGRSLRPKR